MNPSFSHKVCHVLQYNDHGESLILVPGFWVTSQENGFSPIMSGEANKDSHNFLDRKRGMKHLLKKMSRRNKKHRRSSEEGKDDFLRDKCNLMAGPGVVQGKLASWAEKLVLKRSHEPAERNPHQLMSSDSCPRNPLKCWGAQEKEIQAMLFLCIFWLHDKWQENSVLGHTCRYVRDPCV